jgi:radical SAM protein with 4Fe4S-binding SPASM domain
MILNALGVHRPFANAGGSQETLSAVAVVETDGELCMDVEFGEIDRHGVGAEYRLGLNVNDDQFSFERAQEALSARIKSDGLAALPDECQCCPARSLCRGSHPGSRYDDVDRSFNHRSVYCEAMYDLSTELLHHLYQYGYGPHLVDPVLRELRVA